LKTDGEDEAFLEQADSRHDLSDMKLVGFEFQPEDKSITMCMPETLFDPIKESRAFVSVQSPSLKKRG
jgi:predicted DNA binding CopG/RHH family protein